MQLRLRCADIGPAPGELGRNAERDPPRRRGHRFGAGEFATEGARRLRQQQAQGINQLRFLLFQCGDLGANGFHLRGRILDIEPGDETFLLPLLSERQNIPVDLQIFFCDLQLRLGAAQLYVIARDFREA